MTIANVAASLEGGDAFGAGEAGTAPTSVVGSALLGSSALARTASESERPRRTSEVQGLVRAPRSKPPLANLHPPRKVATSSPLMRRVLEVLEPLARADVTVTLTGETGTGKDVLARRIHQQSERSTGPFVVFDCGAVAANLAESELLGHERGSFTGAMATHEGAFERAHGGTLFLDEIGELPLDLQTRLLRVLGNRRVRRVGGTQDREIDVRVVAATNRDLRAEVAAGRFRQDLYFRLAAAVVQVPPLRERLEDLPALVSLLLDDLGYGSVEVTRDALAALAKRPWPGNVRELKNTLSCAVAFIDGTQLEPRHLTFACPPETASVAEPPLGGLRLERVEREAIEQTLRLTGGNKARAAELLGIAPSTLYEKLKKYQRAPKS